MIDLEKKVALITGSSRGIGRGCAIELAKCGADVIINYYRHGDEAEEVAEIVRGLGRSAIVIGADVSDVNAVEEMINEALDYYGQIDILVSNAAMSVRKSFLETTVEEVSKTLDVCMWGVFYVTQIAAKQMVKQGAGGKIVVISSIHALRPFPNAVAYNMAKGAINNMAYTIAGELADYNINVNVIEPGWTDTPGERNFFPEEFLQEAWKNLPLKCAATIEDIGKSVAFFCSSAADHITGSNLRVDGGEWIPARTSSES